MVTETGSVAASTANGASPSRDAAARLAAEARVGGGFDAAALSGRITEAGAGDAAVTRSLTQAVEAYLTPVERGELARAADSAANDNPAPAGTGPDPVQLGLDLGQMALDVAGIFDPTPISDGANAAVSAGRAIGSLFSGNWSEAGGHALNGAISAVAIVPVAGDAAKLGKIGKWAETVGDAVSAVAHNPALRETLAPALEKVRDAIGAIPEGALNALPASARESIDATKRQLDAFFSPTVAATAGNLTARIGANSAEWTVDAAGHPTRVTATLSELQPSGAARGRDELNAQDTTRERGLADDDAGHVIGHRFLGDQGTRNMFPQNFNFNRGAYKTMENEWAAWVEHGGTVKVNVELIGGTGGRPAQVGVRYEVFNDAGQRVHRARTMFDNAAGQTFQRVPTADIERMMR